MDHICDGQTRGDSPLRMARGMKPGRSLQQSLVAFAVLFATFAFLQAPPACGQSDSMPATQNVLRLTPDSAVIAWALPPTERLYDKARMLAARLSSPNENLLADLDGLIARWGQMAGLSGGATLSEILLAQGIDPAAPSCIFLDPTPMTDRAKETAAIITSGGAWWKTIPPHTRKTPEYDWFNLDLVNVVAVFGCSDPKLAERRIEYLAATLFESKAPTVETCAEGVIHVYEDGLACCVAGNQLFLTNHVPMLKETLKRIAAPTPVRYGSTGCPASTADPIVLVTHLDRLRTLLPDLSDVLKRIVNPGQDPQASNEALRFPNDMFTGGDPCITTFDVTQDKVEVASWLDFLAHPQYAAQMGKPRPIRLGTLLPENCQAFGCIQLTEAVKDLFRKRWIPLRSSEKDDVIESLRSFDFLNGEATVGLAVEGTSTPRMFLLAEISDPEAVKTFGGKLAPTASWTDDPRTPGVQFAEFPPNLFAGIYGNVVLIANERETCRALAETLIGKKGTPLFESRTPPIDPAIPIFGMFSLKTENLGATLPSLADMAGVPFPEMAKPIADKASQIFRELRTGKIVQGNWQKVFLTLYFRN